MQWVEKYRPKKIDDVKGQKQAAEKIEDFIKKFRQGNNKNNAIVLYGPPGTGKTTLAYVAANETDSELFELNASDLRDKNRLKEVLEPAMNQQSLVKKGKIILVDEADGITGTDRGGMRELVKLIDNAPCPIVVTANDYWDKKMSSLRKKSERVELKEIDYKTVKGVLIDILRKEKKFIENEILTQIAVKSKGDLRAAVNDLQTAASMEKPSAADFNERNKETNIFNALKKVFKMPPKKETLGAFDSVNMPIDEIILWVEKNIPKEYSGKELEKAYDVLSKVDVFKGRIYKQQYWRFLVYENALLTYGISAAKLSPKNSGSFTPYKKPSRILKIWMNNQRTIKKKSIADKYSQYCHIGKKRALHEFPVIKHVIASNPKIADELKLTEEELEYIKSFEDIK